MRLVLAVGTLVFLLESGGWLSSSPLFSTPCIELIWIVFGLIDAARPCGSNAGRLFGIGRIVVAIWLFISALSFFLLLFSLVSLPHRHFLLDTFAEKASNGYLWIRIVRVVPTRVSSLLSDGFCFPSRRFTFDEMSRMGALSIRLVHGVPTLVSMSNLELY
jgi:hypothetical protein